MLGANIRKLHDKSKIQQRSRRCTPPAQESTHTSQEIGTEYPDTFMNRGLSYTFARDPRPPCLYGVFPAPVQCPQFHVRYARPI